MTVEVLLRCSRCREEKPSAEFNRRNIPRGFAYWCRVCARAAARRDTPNVRRSDENKRLVLEGLKRCSHCDEVLPLSSYAAAGSHVRSGLQSWCRECTSAAVQKRRETPEAVVLENLRKKLTRYNITMEQYDKMFLRQKGRCVICTEPFGAKRPAVVDHDHACCSGIWSCGQCVRSLLCSACNMGLGMFRDNPVALRRAATYVQVTVRK